MSTLIRSFSPTVENGVLAEVLKHGSSQPFHPAAKDLAKHLTYRELCDAAGTVGLRLAERGVREGDRVALHVPNSVDFLLAALGSLWAGATFIPLAVGDPEARHRLILDDCRPSLVIKATRGEDVPALPDSLDQYRSVDISELLEPAPRSPQPPVPEIPGRAAYVIYTSGTTGTPKGVQVSCKAFATAVLAAAKALDLGPQTRALCVSPFHFDGSYATLFSTLVAGGSTVMRPRDALLFPRTFFAAIADENITYASFSPSYLRLLCASKKLECLASTRLEIIALGGEALSVADAQVLWTAIPGIRLFNRYGPTETTIAVTDFELTPDLVAGGHVPIGLPHPGTSFHIIDANGQIIGDSNVIGELYVGGKQLMIGYLGEPTLTTQVIRDDVIGGETVYKTGDLVFRDDQGLYVYFDRADRVVKRNGVRISLVELTKTVQNLSGVSAAVCSAFDDSGQLGNVAFVVPEQTRSPQQLRVEVRTQVPATMIPDRFELVDTLPLTTSNKIDESLLLKRAGLGPAPRAGAGISAGGR